MEKKIDVADYAARVAGPGKFEGEEPETLYFYERSLEGAGGDVLQAMEDGCGTYSELIETTEEERKAFELYSGGEFFLLEEDEQGFVTGCWLTASEGADVRAEAERRDSLKSEGS